MSKEETETHINTPLSLRDYIRLLELKKEGNFSSWKVFFHWLINNKTLSATFIDEIAKLVSEDKQEKSQT